MIKIHHARVEGRIVTIEFHAETKNFRAYVDVWLVAEGPRMRELAAWASTSGAKSVNWGALNVA